MTPTWLEPASPPRGIQLNWANFLDNLRDVGRPHYLPGTYAFDRSDVEERADHIEAVGNAVISYINAVFGDTCSQTSGHIEDSTGSLKDAFADIVGALRKKADAMFVDEAA